MPLLSQQVHHHLQLNQFIIFIISKNKEITKTNKCQPKQTQKFYLNPKQNRISPSKNQGPAIVISDSESFKINLTSSQDKSSILKESPIVISKNSSQIEKKLTKGLGRRIKKFKKRNLNKHNRESKGFKKTKETKSKLPIKKLKQQNHIIRQQQLLSFNLYQLQILQIQSLNKTRNDIKMQN
ncbi:unnamed protein product (macronuclear) [Paramecium tetraurelia]|uniref:Uncharacterized protein n=1 Tax=Paramecium tetraurelia TaxID=5888 RepID=A0DAD5_PARTE|nr:uncharacterized protein GSPATT00014909001 [Paramecium tetraurelia]CAK80002.1 unnamed protein product [Paramecium tetraurelia]|eukprot:XP_001447399.1 hypothetical protein (macronuclear) [Paramecium tetraurelia strain d4-2]